MKIVSFVLLSAACCLPLAGVAEELTEKEVLHATFAAFQEPGVLSGDYIAEQREMLQLAAREGNPLARLVMAKYGNNADGGSNRLSRLTLAEFTPR